MAMKNPQRSAKDKAVKPAVKPAPGKPQPPAAKGRNKAGREEVRHELHRTQVPRQSQRPAERSGQTRSRKP